MAAYHCFFAWIEGMRGHYDLSERYFQQSMKTAKIHLPDFLPFVIGLRAQVILLHQPSIAMRQELTQAIDLAVELTAMGYTIYLWKALALLECILGNYHEAELYVRKGLDRATQFRSGSRIGELLTIQAQIEIARGDISQATTTVERALSLVRAVSPVEEIANTLVTRAEVFLLAGRLDEAEATFEEALTVAPAEHCPLRAQISYGQARTAAARGNRKEARRRGEEALTAFEAIHHFRTAEVQGWLEQYRSPWLRAVRFRSPKRFENRQREA